MGIQEIYSSIENFFGNITDGWKGYALIGGFAFLFIASIVMLIIVAFDKPDIDPMTSKSVFSDGAKAYCISIGFDAMKWINETDDNNMNYTCIYQEKKNESVENFYVKG